jgi:hypothetical protein
MDVVDKIRQGNYYTSSHCNVVWWVAKALSGYHFNTLQPESGDWTGNEADIFEKFHRFH